MHTVELARGATFGDEIAAVEAAALELIAEALEVSPQLPPLHTPARIEELGVDTPAGGR
jgi:hypothetical protein